MAKDRTVRICPQGHQYYKTSLCPVCPVCEAQRKPENSLFVSISAPARRALEAKGIDSAAKLAVLSEKEILALHGMGPSTIPKLKAVLRKQGLQFKK
ncbi:hypothetical protein A8C56_14970 [Niabella ginsenosidivorans]|uniref:RNA polymerase alpha subunit C-terminal domain-containing protein n=1 Tax=Niabella ginsenosidivorans TaxID=1176587 RepID=A0A1A9I613_9BACT|nr:hypothetical protein [Niabella ginsenosidivorans]ANH82102.1 hypothetical protein A8C56_14970 [Niabella ginsenosidivorans]